MSKSLEELVHIYLRLVDYLLSGVLAFVVLKSIREELIWDKETKDDIFIGTVVISSYNTLILTLANSIKPNSDSIHISYFFNCVRESNNKLGDEKYSQIMAYIGDFETELERVSNITKAVIELRDTTVAHVDRKHVNNPSALFKDQPISWDDMEIAISVVSSGLLELGKHLGLGENFPDYPQLANFFLAKKTKKVYDMFYRQ
jgi:hypothetical protein